VMVSVVTALFYICSLSFLLRIVLLLPVTADTLGHLFCSYRIMFKNPRAGSVIGLSVPDTAPSKESICPPAPRNG
jgi:hypothetical protein